MEYTYFKQNSTILTNELTYKITYVPYLQRKTPSEARCSASIYIYPSTQFDFGTNLSVCYLFGNTSRHNYVIDRCILKLTNAAQIGVWSHDVWIEFAVQMFCLFNPLKHTIHTAHNLMCGRGIQHQKCGTARLVGVTHYDYDGNMVGIAGLKSLKNN